eukprot:gene2455-3032_t
MAQGAVKVKKTQTSNKKKPSKVGLQKKKKSTQSATEIARTKIEKKLTSTITRKIETEMAQRVAKNNGKLSVIGKSDDQQQQQQQKGKKK